MLPVKQEEKKLSPLGIVAAITFGTVIILALLNLFFLMLVIIGVFVIIGVIDFLIKKQRGDFTNNENNQK